LEHFYPFEHVLLSEDFFLLKHRDGVCGEFGAVFGAKAGSNGKGWSSGPACFLSSMRKRSAMVCSFVPAGILPGDELGSIGNALGRVCGLLKWPQTC
jgi:hypothetical protein